MVSIRSHLAQERVARVPRALPCNSRTRYTPTCSQAARVLEDELPREAFGVRGACSRFRTGPRLTTAPASWTHSKHFAQFGCSTAALCLLLGLLFSLAAPLSRAAEAPKLDGLFGQWFAVQTNLQSWSADFTQTRSLKVLAQPLISTGKVWVATSRFRWELGQPPQTIALRQPDQLVIIYPRLKRAEKYPLSGVPAGPVKDAFALLDASLPRDRAAMEDRFNLLSATETNATLLVRLQPKSASARKFISEIVIGFHTNNFAIAMTEMQFADGSILRNDFTNVVLNPAIPPEKFEAVLAPDVTVVEPLHR
jgi:outer membrane lipoprotein-sorting protein